MGGEGGLGERKGGRGVGGGGKRQGEGVRPRERERGRVMRDRLSACCFLFTTMYFQFVDFIFSL